jgi:hypothetical protein
MSGAAPKTAEKPSFAHNTLLLSVLSPTRTLPNFGRFARNPGLIQHYPRQSSEIE